MIVFNMGGAVVRHDPESMDLIREYLDAYQILLDTKWISYFERLVVFDDDIALEFS